MSVVGLSQREIDVDNLFTKLGYVTRTHVQIFPIDLKNTASDIDVFAIHFDPHLKPELSLLEVKEGYGTVTDLFQLYGFRTYFQECNAYFIAEKVHDTTREISKSLGISAMTYARLKELVAQDLEWMAERRKTVVELSLDHLRKIIEFLKAIKDVDEELYWVYHHLWLETDPYRKLYNLQRLFSKARGLCPDGKSPVLEAFSWYKRELFCLSLISSINIAYDCIDLEANQIPSYIEGKFLNLGISKEGKLKVKEGFMKLSEQIDKLSKGAVKVPPMEIVPPYVGDLGSLTQLLIRNAPFVHSYLLIDNDIFRANLKGENKNLKEYTNIQIQYRMIKEVNQILLKILYQREPTEMTFKNFV